MVVLAPGEACAKHTEGEDRCAQCSKGCLTQASTS